MQYIVEQHIPGFMLLIDFESAFDSLSWKFIDKVLCYFKFGPSISKWVSFFIIKIHVQQSQSVDVYQHFSCLSMDVARKIQ